MMTEEKTYAPMTLTLKYVITAFAKKLDKVLNNLDQPIHIGSLFAFDTRIEGDAFWRDQMNNGLHENGKRILMTLREEEKNEVVLDLSYPENKEHFATTQRHPTPALGRAAMVRARRRHKYNCVDETLATAITAPAVAPPTPEPVPTPEPKPVVKPAPKAADKMDEEE